MVGFLWHASRGYRFRPWRSPYLRWRMETYWGLSAEKPMSAGQFWDFMWTHRHDLMRFLAWTERMR